MLNFVQTICYTIGSFIVNAGVVSYILQNSMLNAAISLFIMNALVGKVKLYARKLWTYVSGLFLYRYEILYGDDAYNWVLLWLGKQNCGKNARKLALTTSFDRNLDSDLTKLGRPNANLTPGSGTHFFTYKGKWIWLYRNGPGTKRQRNSSSGMNFQGTSFGNQKMESIHISHFGWDRSVVESLVKEAQSSYFEQSSKTTWIYRIDDYGWKMVSSQDKRQLETVILPNGVKDRVKRDLVDFRNSEQWYYDCGVPYRRGYLFYGTPGTGKTSLITALSGELGMNICILSCSDPHLSDTFLLKLVNSVPPNSILALEDIDSAFIHRKSNLGESVTFSGLLNALDGCATESLIFCMTTNYIHRLDSALIRPGRVDFRLEFKEATKEQVEKFFLKFYPGKEKLAKKFADRIPDCTVTPAQLQGFFFTQKSNPELLFDKIDQFLAEGKKMIESMEKRKDLEELESNLVKKTLEKVRNNSIED